MATDDVLRLEGVRKSYGVGTTAETEVLHGIDLALARGEFCALMGPSGSGKSTLLNIMGLLDRPDAGRIWIDGNDTSGLGEADLTRLRGHAIGFVFQYHHLISAFTALENVMMPMLLERGRADDAMNERARALLDQVGLLPWQNNRATNMSGGQQQRVAIARALAMNPALILADEPTGNLDTKSAEGVFTLLRQVSAKQGTTVLMVTHNHQLAGRCDRIVELVDGRIVAPVTA
ncbi:Lipoprotein-releasing system ATP-binding protein LolD [Variovorax sp. RA8]|nr:ABC transporter ATP-binding protein [Variovorax sp. RA8]VTU21630.1 Lipoprotein-releasing system ATP-binding protein LolD [Variovorax sp. RA8]